MVPSNLTLSAFYYSLLWVQTQNIKLNTLASATIPLQRLPRNLFRGASSLSPKHQTNLIYFKKLIQASSFGTLYQSLSLQCSRALKFAFLLSFFIENKNFSHIKIFVLWFPLPLFFQVLPHLTSHLEPLLFWLSLDNKKVSRNNNKYNIIR